MIGTKMNSDSYTAEIAELDIVYELELEDSGPTQEAMDASAPLYQYQQELLDWVHRAPVSVLPERVTKDPPKVFKMVRSSQGSDL